MQNVTGISNIDYKNFLIVGCPKVGDTNYAAATGADVSSVEFRTLPPMIGLHMTEGSGNIAVEMLNGGKMILPITVAAGDSREVLRGHKINAILSTAEGTTFDGYIFPVF